MTEGNGRPAGILSLKSWTRVQHKATAMSYEVKRLQRLEVLPLDQLLTKIVRKMQTGIDVPGDREAELMGEVHAMASNEELAFWFGGCVRNVDGLELDGVPVTTGEGLLRVIDQRGALDVLSNILAQSRLSANEGNVSRSPSTSPPETAGASSVSAATPTESADGIARFGATESQETDLSSPRAEA